MSTSETTPVPAAEPAPTPVTKKESMPATETTPLPAMEPTPAPATEPTAKPAAKKTDAVELRPTRAAVVLPRNSPWVTIGLLLLSLVLSPLAIYLDGGSSVNVAINLVLYIHLLWWISIPWAFIFILRSRKKRNMSRPWRSSLWARNGEGLAPHPKAATKKPIAPKQDEVAATPRPNEDPLDETHTEMWKRLQGYGREKERQIGNPVLLETTYDGDQLRHIPNVADAQNANYHHHAASGHQPFEPLSPPQAQFAHENRVSEVPTESSFYSQPSPEVRYDDYSAYTRQPGLDISPPSSPEPDHYQQQDSDRPRRFRSMRDVSPVDENRGLSTASTRAGSHIPVLRKASPSLRNESNSTPPKFWGGKVAPNSKVRWDEYSGEPASGNAGRPSQVNPGTYEKEVLAPASERRPMGYHVTVTGPQSNAKKNASTANRSGAKPSPVETKPHEPWSRAMGRSEIAKPIKDQPSDKPLKVPRKSEPVKASGYGKGVSNSLALSSKPEPDTGSVANTEAQNSMHEDAIKPIVPLKVVGTSPPRGLASPTSPHNPANPNPYSYPSPITPTNKQPLTSNTGGNRGASSEAVPSEPGTPKARKASIEGTPASADSKGNGTTSRFSWTTYNTSTTYQHSPPPSPPPPIPTSQTPASAAASILNRKRPVAVADKIPSRKPVASIASGHATIMSSGPPSPRPDSTYSTSTQKALPRPPMELTAADHVEVLESQMEDLRIRRNNVYRLLNDLNHKIPSNPMITDFKRMRLVDQRKKDYAEELAEIKREEHDVGLKLHRAWRKRDDQSESALWVRRVTQ